MRETSATYNGRLPKDWEEVSIGSITALLYRYPTYYGITYVEEGVPEVRGELLLDNGEIESDRSKFRFITEDTANKFPKVRLEPGDIVMSVRGTMGKIGIVRQSLRGAVITANLIRLSPQRAVIIPDFLRLALLTPEFINALNGASPQTTIKTITAQALKGLTLAVPHAISEQRKIAAVLGLVQRAIEQRERLITLTTELKRALLHKLFTEGLRSEPQKQTEIGPVPKSWEVLPLGEFLTEGQYGLSTKGADNGTYPLLRMTNQQEGRISANHLQYVELTQEQFRKFRMERQDILFNRTNSLDLVGRTAVFDIDGDFVFASYLIRLRTDAERLRPFFLNHYFNWDETQRRLKSIATRAVSQSNISATRLRGFDVPVPEPKEQDEIVENLECLDRNLALHTRKKQSLSDLFRTLLHRLMTAEIRFQDLELPTGET